MIYKYIFCSIGLHRYFEFFHNGHKGVFCAECMKEKI